MDKKQVSHLLGRISAGVLLLTNSYLSYGQEPSEPQRTIRSITIENGSIFDLADDRENGFLYRIANKLHIETRKHIIEQQLLFKLGDVYSAAQITESERLLRINRYLAEAKILASVDGDYVDVVVTTQDTWSTKPKLSYSQAGGSQKSEIGVKEQNLFGSGVSADLSYKSDVDRSTYIVGVEDRHLFGTWYSLGISNESSSDGNKKEINLEKPFYSLTSKDSHGIKASEDMREDAFYHLGNKYYVYSTEERSYVVQSGWSTGLNNGKVFRHTLGVRHHEHRYSAAEKQYDTSDAEITQFLANNSLIPKDRKDVYPFYALDYLEDRYQEVINIDRLGKLEDRYMGLKAGFQVGFGTTQLGSIENALLLEGYLEKTFNLSPRSSVAFESLLSLRKQEGERRSFITALLARYYHEQTNHFKFYSDISSTKGHNLDLHNYLALGGDTGLRGFPANYLSGDQIHKMTIEERYYSDVQPFRIFQLGAALFFDVAQITGGNPLEQDFNGTYSDVGIGLRIANNRSSLGDIIHIDLAVPVGGQSPDKGFQINIQLKSTF
jgi:outer membrane protein assembly factor BamA